MELEHYPGMTEKAIEAMIDEAQRRFDIFGARVVHRVGLLQPLDQIVLVAVTSAHRGDSFQACEFLMDYLKTQAPFCKKEQTPQAARWGDAPVSDYAALAKWGIAASNA
jgi:molybdopterin synthase catalytic subunit